MTYKRLRFLPLAVPAALLLLPASPADACSPWAPWPRHEIDPAEEAIDTQPPDAPVIGAIEVVAFEGSEGCALPGAECGDSRPGRWVRIPVTARDNRTPLSNMGYRITPDDNTPSFINSGDIRANEGMLTIQLRTEEPLSFDLEIRSIDLAGNVSTGHSVARVSDPGSAGGCAIQRGTGSTPRRAGLTPVVALIAAVLAGLRRRRYDAPSA